MNKTFASTAKWHFARLRKVIANTAMVSIWQITEENAIQQNTNTVIFQKKDQRFQDLFPQKTQNTKYKQKNK